MTGVVSLFHLNNVYETRSKSELFVYVQVLLRAEPRPSFAVVENCLYLSQTALDTLTEWQKLPAPRKVQNWRKPQP